MRILRASDRALLVETADVGEAMRWDRALSDAPGIVERIPGARSVLVLFDPLIVSETALADRIRALVVDDAPLPRADQVRIPVHYDGEDLDVVAALLGLSAEELVERHAGAEWLVAFSGFAPGFGYLVCDDPLFDVPRRPSPRTRVPAGSVGLAGEFSGVYPRASPGGWQLIGRTDAVLWDVDRDPPALLPPGTRVRFEPVSGDGPTTGSENAEEPVRGVEALRAVDLPVDLRHPRRGSGGVRDEEGLRAPSGGAVDEPFAESTSDRLRPPSAIEVVQRSLQLLVQDVGRPGFAALGVSASGAADRTALRDANRAIGNAPTAAVLECVGAATLRFHGAGVAVVTGAIGELWLSDAAGRVRPIEHGAPFATADGDELHLGHPGRGIRYVIGARGGVDAASVLGSRSSDTLAGLGPAPLKEGDVVAIGDEVVGAVDPVASPRELAGDVVELDITLGPRDDWFAVDAIAALTGQEWDVTPRSDRVGVRLHGKRPLARAVTGELPSEGAVTGAIQVPADGQPVLFLADHPLTGGYPIIGAVTDRCLDLVAQLPPGARVRFRVG